MSMFNETPTGMFNLHMRIPCVSTNMPCNRNNLNTLNLLTELKKVNGLPKPLQVKTPRSGWYMVAGVWGNLPC